MHVLRLQFIAYENLKPNAYYIQKSKILSPIIFFLYNIILTYINVKSIRHKLNDLYALTAETVDVLCIAESKLDKSFPGSQFLLPGSHKPYRLDKTAMSGGLLVYVRSSIASHLQKQKWLLLALYRSPDQNCLTLLTFFQNYLMFMQRIMK